QGRYPASLTSSPSAGILAGASWSGTNQLRFAVHGPGNPVASPRSHGVPRRDVSGRVCVSVVGVPAGYAAEQGLALAAVRCDVPACRAPLAGEMRSYLFD